MNQDAEDITYRLMHPFANRIGLRILTGGLNILHAEHGQEPLEFASNELATFIMQNPHGARITSKPAHAKLLSNMLSGFVVHSDQLNQI